MHYRLEQSTDLNIIGCSPQIQNAVFPVHLDNDPRSTKSFWYEVADLNKLIFPEPIIQRKAKATDFIPCYVIGTRSMPLISKRLMNLIHNSQYAGIQFIPAKIHFNNEEMHSYFFLNIYEFQYQCIDFEESKTYFSSFKIKPKSQPIKVNHLNEFLKIENNLKPPIGLEIDPLFFNNQVENLDFFGLSWVKGGVSYYISEKLKSEFEKENITGFTFVDINQ